MMQPGLGLILGPKRGQKSRLASRWGSIQRTWPEYRRWLVLVFEQHHFGYSMRFVCISSGNSNNLLVPMCLKETAIAC